MAHMIHELVKKAKKGDKKALAELIGAIRDRVYNLSLRMLWSPEEAEDASQEILIKIINNLDSFKERSTFTTWVYRVASNYLLSYLRSHKLKHQITFSDFSKGLEAEFEENISAPGVDMDNPLLEEEAKIGCTHAILLCLEPEARLVFILHYLFGIKSSGGAELLDIKAEAYRKRLSRAKKSMENFLEGNCGLVNPRAGCRCKKRLPIAIHYKRLVPRHLLFAGKKTAEDEEVARAIKEMNEIDRIAGVFQSNPYYSSPEGLTKKIKELIESKQFSLLEEKK